jgi:hypothetical protein
LFKVKSFPFYEKDKSHIFDRTKLLLDVARPPCLLCFETICAWSLFIYTNQICLFQVFALLSVVAEFSTGVTDFRTAVWD